MRKCIVVFVCLCMCECCVSPAYNDRILVQLNAFETLQFTDCNVAWDDVIEKISDDFEDGSFKILNVATSLMRSPAPTFVLMNDYYPNSVGEVFNKVQKKEGIRNLHVYASLGNSSLTYGNHNDDIDVLLIQSIGSTLYGIEGDEYTLAPGDGMFIPAGVYHDPIVIEPRVTLSFAWDK